MGENSSSTNQPENPTTTPWRPNDGRLALMLQRISDPPRILSRSAGRSSCCIFNVPQTLMDINGRSYQPYIVSVGPYHHGEPKLNMIQEHKWRFLGALLKRTRVSLESLLRAVHPLEARARECYSAAIHMAADEFTEMLVVDGCFVIELFRKFGGVAAFEADDPLLALSWVYSFFLRDLIRLQNQIPFFVLQCLFDLTREDDSDPTLPDLTLRFFNNVLQRSDDFVGRPTQTIAAKHVLDLLRSSFIPEHHDEAKPGHYSNTHIITCISKLRRAGIKLRPAPKGQSFLVVKFRHGTIEMPTITIDDFMCAFLLNCVAYEQCRGDCSKHMTTYATLLDCLVNTPRDVEYLCDQNIIENYLGTDAEVAAFINRLGKDVSFDIDACYLSGVFNEVNEYYEKHWHVHVASFKYMYFRTPWSFISALAALVLLLLTVAQTYFTMMSYIRPPN